MPARLDGWDYTSNGAYFVTVVTYRRRKLFGIVVGEDTILSPLGELTAAQLVAAVRIVPDRQLDAWVVMPDHVHAIVLLQGETPQEGSILAMVAQFKAATTYAARRSGRYSRVEPLWQRGFYDRVVRNGRELDELREYIATNPARWTVARATADAGRRTKSDGYT